MDLAPGTRLGTYEILAPLGAGGMGKVYRAFDRKLGREVALKVLRRDVVGGSDGSRRFEREAHLLAAINHPNVATLYAFEECDGLPFLVMELVVGQTLAEYRRRGPLPLGQALAFACQIARALEAAHARGIIHRDLKPGNVAIADDGTVKVLDFGLAKAVADLAAPAAATGLHHEQTSEGLILGTPAYVSPEQARGQALDERSDVWSFGCVLYEMLSGRSAFARKTTADTLAAVLERAPDWSALPASLPAHVGRILRRCLEKDRERRPRSIRDVRTELEGGDQGETTPFRPRRESSVQEPTAPIPAREARSRREPAPRPRRGVRWKGPLLLGCLTVVTLVALVVGCVGWGINSLIIEPRQFHDVTGPPGRWTKTEGGLTLSVDKVEASSGRFRVWMTATNKTNERLSLPLFGHFFVTDDLGKQYEADPFSSTFPGDVAPGASVTGYAEIKEPLSGGARKLKASFTTVFGTLNIRSIAVEDVAVRPRQ